MAGGTAGRRTGRVLLEDYAFAVVPSGPFLLEQLTQPTDPKREAGALLAVGGVAHDRGDKVGRPSAAAASRRQGTPRRRQGCDGATANR